MNFSVNQWLSIFALDFLARAALTSIRQPHLLNFLIEIPFSVVYLTLLICANGYVRTFHLPIVKGATIVLAGANIVFVAIYIVLSTYYAATGRVTMCTDYKCTWVGGSITWLGVQTIATNIAIKLIANVIPFLIVLIASSHLRKKAAQD